MPDHTLEQRIPVVNAEIVGIWNLLSAAAAMETPPDLGLWWHDHPHAEAAARAWVAANSEQYELVDRGGPSLRIIRRSDRHELCSVRVDVPSFAAHPHAPNRLAL